MTAEMQKEAIAEIKDLTVAFQTSKGNLTPVDDVSFSLIPGKTVALLGESGCGKSMTSLAFMRLLPSYSRYGQKSRIDVAGQDVLELPERVMQHLRGRRLAMIFQEPMTALNPVLSIQEQLVEALNPQKLKTHALKERMLELLREVELPQPEKKLDQYPHQLSGGQKQRVVIAMALANHPEILVADEPTTALDASTQAQILALLKKLQHQYRMSLLLITHDLGVVRLMADQVCVMYAGQIVESSPVHDFFEKPLHPYAQQLLLSLPSLAKRHEKLKAIKGSVPGLEHRPTGCRFHPRCVHAFESCSEKEPGLQTLSSDREVRCHLYPEHAFPPPLPHQEEYWPIVETQVEPVLTVEHLKVYFSTQKHVLSEKELFKAVDDVSFHLYPGKTLALVGESGCGKTTVLKAILQLQEITSGDFFYRGQNLTHLRGRSLKAFRKNVQVIFQDPYSSLNPRMTVGDILAEGMLAHGLSSKRIARQQESLLDQVNLPKNSLHRYPHQFSGGQRQRICIARALAVEPEILLCDEPTSALDISVQAQILNLLKTLQQERSLAYLFITHNMSVVAYMADEVLVMKGGRRVEQGSCEQILNHPTQDYTRHLLESVL